MGLGRRWLLTLLGLLGACAGRCSFEGGETPAPPPGCPAPPLRGPLGEVLLLRGVNVSAEAKWRKGRLPPVDAAELRRMREQFGFGAVRLLVFWEAIEPRPGLYDEGYLQAVRELVRQADEAGLRVVVDMHQDLYGEGFGEAGAPWWSCEPSLYDTFVPQKPWFLGYLQREVGECFERLYAPGPTREAFVAAWARLAETLRGLPVRWLGLDLLNEPFWGQSSVSRLERELLPDFYAQLAEELRLRLPEAWLLLEPAPTVNVGLPTELPALPPGPSVYAPHLYPAATEMGAGWDAEDEPGLRDQVAVLCADAARLRAPLLVGEFGVRRDVPGATDFLHTVYEALDEAQVGGFVWGWERGGPRSYGLLDRDGNPSPQGLAAARPYPERVVGRPHRWRFDPASRRFELTWQEGEEALGETVVALPTLVYPEGGLVELGDGGEWHREGSRLHVPAIGGRRLRHLRLAPVPPPAADAGPPDGAPPETGPPAAPTPADAEAGPPATAAPPGGTDSVPR